MLKRMMVVLLFCMISWTGIAWAKPHATAISYPPDIAHIKNKGNLVVAIYAGGAPPFFYLDNKGQWAGIDIDLAKMIAEQLGVKLIIKTSPTYDGIIDIVAERKADMGMGLLGITPQRALKVGYSDSYYSFNPHLFFSRVRLGQLGWTVWNAVDEMKQTNQPIKIAVLESSLTYSMAKENFPNAEVIPFANINDAFQAVTEGKILVAISSAPGEIENWFDTHPQSALQGAEVSLPEQVVIVGIAVPWQSENVRQWLNIYLEYVRMNHILEHLFEKYDAKNLES